MVSSLDIYPAADLLVKRPGKLAPLQAGERAHQFVVV